MVECPFCGRDPFHYVDIGVGIEAVAVICCGPGDLFFRGQRPTPDEVTLSWDEFVEVAETLRRLRDKPPVHASAESTGGTNA